MPTKPPKEYDSEFERIMLEGDEDDWNLSFYDPVYLTQLLYSNNPFLKLLNKEEK